MKPVKIDTEEFIKRAKKIHGETYDYSLVSYKRMKDKVTIICKKHGGEFTQRADIHLGGHGCSLCAAKRRGSSPETQEQFLKKAVAKHGNKYGYEKTVYKGSAKRITIFCNHHKEYFEQMPYTHLRGHGCTKCSGEEKRRRSRSNTEEFTKKAIKVHGNKYDYSKVDYYKSTEKVCIICKKHNAEFYQPPGDHLVGHGCPICGARLGQKKLSDTKEVFIIKAEAVHGDKYDYSEVEYLGSKVKVKIWCKEHKSYFHQSPMSHVKGATGCSKCFHVFGGREADLAEFVAGFVKIKTNDRKILKGKELDIVIPSLNTAVEFNGSVWHSERFHKDPKWHMLEKQTDCEKSGIRLIHVNEGDDIVIVKKLLAHTLGFDTEKYYARQCKILKAKSSDSAVKKFFEENHLQGPTPGCKAYLLTINNSIVAGALFSTANSERGNSDTSRFELRRFASCCRVVGGASRLLKAFIRDTPECTSLISYSDNRLFTGNMYEKLGFKLVHETYPDYCYTKTKTVAPKWRFKRSELEKRADIDFRPEETEVQNANRNGWYRLWDCGKKKWELTI